MMSGKRTAAVSLTLVILLAAGVASAQGSRGQIDEVVLLDNDSIRLVLLTYHPGADSDLHMNIGPEITIVQEGQLTLYTSKGPELLRTGAAHWLPPSTVHLGRNESDRPVRFWSLLLKRCD
jgi:quercetin dioxygenase-like cupin family protein